MSSKSNQSVTKNEIKKAIENYLEDGDSFPNENITKNKINNIVFEIFRVCYFGFLAAISFSIAAFSYMGASLQLFEMTLPLKVFIGFSIAVGIFVILIFTIALFFRYVLKGLKNLGKRKRIEKKLTTSNKIPKKYIENVPKYKKSKILEEKIVEKKKKTSIMKKDIENKKKNYYPQRFDRKKLNRSKSCNDLSKFYKKLSSKNFLQFF